MPSTQYLIGGAILAAAATGSIELAKEPPAAVSPIEIRRLSYDPVADRVTYHPFAAGHTADSRLLAIWSAYVIPIPKEDEAATPAPICKGGAVGRYRELERPSFWGMDFMVGDEGCRARLSSGRTYEMVVTLAPLDGRLPAGAHVAFTVP